MLFFLLSPPVAASFLRRPFAERASHLLAQKSPPLARVARPLPRRVRSFSPTVSTSLEQQLLPRDFARPAFVRRPLALFPPLRLASARLRLVGQKFPAATARL